MDMGVFHWKHGLWLLLLVLAQVLVLNQIHVGGYATPFAYVYFMLKLNRCVRINVLLLLGFFLGLTIDVFSNTPGMHAAATTLLAFVRSWLLTLFMSRDSADDWEPGIRSMGFSSFLGYVLLSIFFHHAILLLLDTFSFFSWSLLLLKVLCSTALTTFCIMMMECVRRK